MFIETKQSLQTAYAMEFSMSPQNCRACLKVTSNSKLLTDPYVAGVQASSIETELLSYLDIYKLLILFADSQCSSEAEELQLPPFYPQRICDHCEAQLIVAYEFRRKSVRSETVLKNILSKYSNEVKNEIIEVEQYYETLDESLIESCDNDTTLESLARSEDILQKQHESHDGIDEQPDRNHNAITADANSSYLRNEHDDDTAKDDCSDAEKEEIEYVLEEFLDYEQESESNEDIYADSDEIQPQGSKHKTSQCPICGKNVSMHYMAKHKEVHKDKANRSRPFQCDQCEACFTLKENLYKHKRIHSNDKRYTCPFCNEQFLHWASRRYHVASQHTGEKRFTCEYCGAKFRNSSQYLIHIRRHTGVTPYPCHICDRRFITSNSLKTHLLSHSDSKNYHCDICQKSYKSSKTLRLHRKTLHEQEKNYRCPLCERAFSQNHVLKSHLLRTHPEYEPPPPGTIVNVRAVRRMSEQISKLNSDS